MKPVRAAAAFHLAKSSSSRTSGRTRTNMLAFARLGDDSGSMSNVRPRPGVFIVRGATGSRRVLQNEMELAERLRDRRGFTVLDPIKEDVHDHSSLRGRQDRRRRRGERPHPRALDAGDRRRAAGLAAAQPVFGHLQGPDRSRSAALRLRGRAGARRRLLGRPRRGRTNPGSVHALGAQLGRRSAGGSRSKAAKLPRPRSSRPASRLRAPPRPSRRSWPSPTI